MAKYFDKIVVELFKLVSRLINTINIRIQGVNSKKASKYFGIVQFRNRGRISIESDVKIISSYAFNPVGSRNKTSIFCSNEGEITIGKNTQISNALIYSKYRIRIGENVFIGGGVQIFDTDFHSLRYEERIKQPDLNVKAGSVSIEDGSFIGTNSIICKGVCIGAYSVVAAGSVIVKSIPSNEVWGGNPAKFIKKINE